MEVDFTEYAHILAVHGMLTGEDNSIEHLPIIFYL